MFAQTWTNAPRWSESRATHQHGGERGHMGKAVGVREVGYFDCEGGGQIMVDGNYAYIGHVDKTTGTTIVDVSDPKKPRQVANVPTAPVIHAHKVRVANGLMLMNREHPPRAKGPPLTAEELAQPVGL